MLYCDCTVSLLHLPASKTLELQKEDISDTRKTTSAYLPFTSTSWILETWRFYRSKI